MHQNWIKYIKIYVADYCSTAAVIYMNISYNMFKLYLAISIVVQRRIEMQTTDRSTGARMLIYTVYTQEAYVWHGISIYWASVGLLLSLVLG